MKQLNKNLIILYQWILIMNIQLILKESIPTHQILYVHTNQLNQLILKIMIYKKL